MTWIDEIEERLDRLAPAPWEEKWMGTLGSTEVNNHYAAEEINERIHISVRRMSYGGIPPEGVFIAEARTDIPKLLNVARASIELVKELKDIIGYYDLMDEGLDNKLAELVKALDFEEEEDEG